MILRLAIRARCHHCHGLILTNRAEPIAHPTHGLITLHRRCINPIKLTRTGNLLLTIITICVTVSIVLTITGEQS